MSEPKPTVPEGLEFFDLLWHQEEACQAFTDEELPKMGVKGIACLREMGTALSYLDRVSSCWWNCPGGEYKEHTIQYIAGRACNLARASVRLTRFGFYDEALNLVRSMGEIANLLTLFQLDASEISEWSASDHKKRMQKFSPRHVRERVSALSSYLPMDQVKYGLLCELATHPVPEMRPQSHNAHGLVVSGGTFQEGAVLMLLNEIGLMVATILVMSSVLAKVPTEQRERIRDVAKDLVKSVGRISVTNLQEAYKDSNAKAADFP